MIELNSILVNTGKFTLDNISTHFEAGKFHVLLGPSGSGKTILLETIAGLINPKSGTITLNGQNITKFSPENRNLSYLPQDNALFPNKNVFENIAFGLRLKNRLSAQEINDKISDIALKLNIEDILKRSTANLSGGEQQRVALARAVVLENPFLLLDEPTSSLHETMQEDFCLLLKDIQRNLNLTILMTTHHKDSAFLLADKLHFIENGKLLLSTESSKITSIPIPIKIASLLGITNLFEIYKVENSNNMFHCPQLNINLMLSQIPDNFTHEIRLGVKPVDIRVIKEEEKNNSHMNSFNAYVTEIFYKESDALVYLTIHETGFNLKMELSIYNMNKLNIQKGIHIQCKIKEEHSRIIY